MNTHKIILEGFDHIQTAMLYAKLGDIEIPNNVINISLTQSINYGKYDHIWYGGTMVIVQYKDNEFELVANGDIRANLYSKPDNNELAMVKDKSNYGLFYDEMASYIENDVQLYQILDGKDPKYALDIHDENWFEVFMIKIDGKPTQESYVSDFNNIYEAIADIVGRVEELRKWYIEGE